MVSSREETLVIGGGIIYHADAPCRERNTKIHTICYSSIEPFFLNDLLKLLLNSPSDFSLSATIVISVIIKIVFLRCRSIQFCWHGVIGELIKIFRVLDNYVN